MNAFKFQHPSDIVSRVFILEYMKDLGPKVLYEKANKHQKELMFYKFTNEEDFEDVDVNWEYCMFSATLYQLESFMKLFLKEIEELEASRKAQYDKIAEQLRQEEIAAPTDINVMDLAATEIKKNTEGGFQLN